jgi:hypothetical protein
MAIKLSIDENLLNEAKVIGNHKTNEEAVNAALHEYIQRRKQEQIFLMFGKVQYDFQYYYKKSKL